VKRLAVDERIKGFATAILGERVYAVRSIYFDKIADANWSLFWHQDNVIAVKDQKEIEGYVAWSQKAGVWQVQPPPEILARVVTVRIHLDVCDRNNGPLRVLPGSHRHGWLDDELDHWKHNVAEVVCTVGMGGVVAMCPLTLHASAPAQQVRNRRVIHLEYSSDELPGDLDWRWRI
jgi:ectoine hydroxylase-related dioxygenase (phytanoyl-CoA dioxygenase family)